MLFLWVVTKIEKKGGTGKGRRERWYNICELEQNSPQNKNWRKRALSCDVWLNLQVWGGLWTQGVCRLAWATLKRVVWSVGLKLFQSTSDVSPDGICMYYTFCNCAVFSALITPNWRNIFDMNIKLLWCPPQHQAPCRLKELQKHCRVLAVFTVHLIPLNIWWG